MIFLQPAFIVAAADQTPAPLTTSDTNLPVAILLHLRMWALLVGVILIVTTLLIMFLVHLRSLLLSMALRLLSVVPVLALGLGESVDLCTGETGDQFLGELM